MNNLRVRTALASSLVLAATAAAAQATTYGDVARVISATPIHETAPDWRRECRTEPVTAYEQRRSIRPGPAEYAPAASEGIGPGTVLGAIIGGVIGHQFGGTSAARDAATVGGALLGGIVGNSAENDARAGYGRAGDVVTVERVPVTRDVERCREVPETRERIVGYDVHYEYNGREFRIRMPHDPGPQMAVNVDVRPPLPSLRPIRPSYRGTF